MGSVGRRHRRPQLQHCRGQVVGDRDSGVRFASSYHGFPTWSRSDKPCSHQKAMLVVPRTRREDPSSRLLQMLTARVSRTGKSGWSWAGSFLPLPSQYWKVLCRLLGENPCQQPYPAMASACNTIIQSDKMHPWVRQRRSVRRRQAILTGM